MHIPDGFLDVKTWAALDLAGAGAVVVSSAKVSKYLSDRAVPLMAVTAAFVFAAQMLNFPIAGGTSGHFLGGALTAVILGPWAACVVLTGVLVVQSLLFQDGGVLVLGANIINIAVVAPWCGYLVYRLFTKFVGGRKGTFVAAFVAGWISVVAAAAACAAELAVAGTVPLSVGVPAMVGVHALIGAGEGIVTASALALISAARPELVISYGGGRKK